MFLLIITIPKNGTADVYFSKINNEPYVLLHGEITQKDYYRISEIIKNQRYGIFDLYLNSEGGDVDAALKIGDLLYNSYHSDTTKSSLDGKKIRVKNATTATVQKNGICASACVFILASAKVRQIESGGAGSRIIVHSPYSTNIYEDANTTESIFKSIKSRAINQFERVGVSRSLWDLMVKTSSDTSHELTSNEAEDTNLFGADPAAIDYINNIMAQMHGITKVELLKRMNLYKKCNERLRDHEYCLDQVGLSNKKVTTPYMPDN